MPSSATWDEYGYRYCRKPGAVTIVVSGVIVVIVVTRLGLLGALVD